MIENLTNKINHNYSVYDFNSLSLQDLLCEYFNKINECIDSSNKALTFIEWLKEIGVKAEVVTYLDNLLSSGKLKDIINNEIFTELNTKLNSCLSDVDNVSSLEINMLKEGFLFNGSDESSKLQALLNEHRGKYITLTFPYGKEITLNNIVYSGDLLVKGNMCTIRGTNSYLFNTGDDSAYLHLTVENLVLKGTLGLANLSLINHDNTGTSIHARGIKAYCDSRTINFIKVTSTDFLNVENVTVSGYDRVVQAMSDVVGSDRANTQISVKNFSCYGVNYGLELRGCSKFNIQNYDISVCKSGMIIHDHNVMGNVTNFHCEYHGAFPNESDGDGYGIFVNWITNQITFDCCDIILPSTNARGGVFMTAETYGDIYYNKIKFTNCSVPPYDTPIGYKALTLNGAYLWEGEFHYKNKDVSFGGVNNKILLGEIKPSMYNNFSSRNLLEKTKFTQASDFTYTTGSGSATFADDNGYTLIHNTTGQDVTYVAPLNIKNKGWHTIIFNGSCGENIVSIGEIYGSWRTVFSSFCSTIYDYQTNRIYFYVDDLSYTPTIQFSVRSNTMIKLGDIGLYQGFRTYL